MDNEEAPLMENGRINMAGFNQLFNGKWSAPMTKCSDLNRGEIRHAVQNAFDQYGPKPTVDQITDWVFTSFAPKFPEPKHQHQWEDVYQHGGHYPDGKRCKACQLFDLQGTPPECLAHQPKSV